MDRTSITPELVTALIAEQFPALAHLRVAPVDVDGWDNTTLRLGGTLSVRLPSADGYVPQVEKEHRWLPVLGPQLPLPIPTPVAVGRPGCGFPRPWSIYRWIDGEPAGGAPIADVERFAADLGGFLAALQAADATGGPPPGPHNFHRGGPVATYDTETREQIAVLAGEIDAAGATEVWDTALATAWERPPVWVHGDVGGSNLLVEDGRLGAVIDFGCCGVGDPACDLVMAWTFFTGAGREAFRDRLALDAATWARAHGWALWKALITLARPGAGAAAHRFGWRIGAGEVIAEVIADHRRTT